MGLMAMVGVVSNLYPDVLGKQALGFDPQCVIGYSHRFQGSEFQHVRVG